MWYFYIHTQIITCNSLCKINTDQRTFKQNARVKLINLAPICVKNNFVNFNLVRTVLNSNNHRSQRNNKSGDVSPTRSLTG